MFCEHCGNAIRQPWPVEPLYTMDVVAAILGVKLTTLTTVLNREFKHWPRRYNLITHEGRTRPGRARMLTAGEVKVLRSRFTWEGKRSANKVRGLR